MKKIFFFVLIGLTIFSFFKLSYAEDAEDESRVDRKLYRIFDDVDLIYASNTSYGANRITIKTIFPKLLTDSDDESVDAFNETVNDLINEEISVFKKEVANHQIEQKTLPKKSRMNDMEIDFNASTINAKKTHIVSVRFSIRQYIAGTSHPKLYHRVLNYDMDNNDIFALSDLFSKDADFLSVFSVYSRKELSRHLQNKTMIEQGTEPTLENFKNWNIKAEGLLFTFDENQVAPYVEGTQTVLIPYRFLKGMIRKDSIIATCALGKNKCTRNNLLTGGFVDEAMNLRHRRFNPIFG